MASIAAGILIETLGAAVLTATFHIPQLTVPTFSLFSTFFSNLFVLTQDARLDTHTLIYYMLLASTQTVLEWYHIRVVTCRLHAPYRQRQGEVC